MNLEDTEALVRQVRDLSPTIRRDKNLALLENPPLVDIELASSCNIVCSFCPRGAMQRRSRLMSEDTFRAVERLVPPDAIVMLSGLGDALLHPALPEWTRRLTASGRAPCVITNGVALTPACQDRLIHAGVSQLQVSVHGLDRATVTRVVTRGARPDRVRRHLERLAAVRPASFRVRINFVETQDNGHSRLEVEELATTLGFDFFYRREHNRGGTHAVHLESTPSEGCGIFAAVTFITADGDIPPCVNDVRGEHAIGNARELTWRDVVAWKARTIRNGAWFGPCSTCNDDYRWVLLGQGRLDEEGATAGGTGPNQRA